MHDVSIRQVCQWQWDLMRTVCIWQARRRLQHSVHHLVRPALTVILATIHPKAHPSASTVQLDMILTVTHRRRVMAMGPCVDLGPTQHVDQLSASSVWLAKQT